MCACATHLHVFDSLSTLMNYFLFCVAGVVLRQSGLSVDQVYDSFVSAKAILPPEAIKLLLKHLPSKEQVCHSWLLHNHANRLVSLHVLYYHDACVYKMHYTVIVMLFPTNGCSKPSFPTLRAI